MSVLKKLIDIDKEISALSKKESVFSKELLKLLERKMQSLKDLYREIIEPVSLKLNYEVLVKVGDRLDQSAGLTSNSFLKWDGPENAGLNSGFESLYLRDYVFNRSDQPLSFLLWKGKYQNLGGLVLRYLEKDVYDG